MECLFLRQTGRTRILPRLLSWRKHYLSCKFHVSTHSSWYSTVAASDKQKMSNSINNVVDLTSDSEDEDLRRAIMLSLQCPPSTATVSSINSTVQNLPQTASNSLIGISRAQMEQERLVRLKRKRGEYSSVSPPPLTRKLNATASTLIDAQPQRVNDSKANGPQRPHSDALQPQVQPPISTTSTSHFIGQRFLQPCVKQTWCFGFPQTSTTIKIEEVFDRANLESAVLSSFIWDFDWLFPKLDTKRTKFVLVMQGKEQRQRVQMQSDFGSIPNVRLCFPPMDGQVNCMHSKLMLLFFPTHLRVVVPSANLVPFDWGEDGVMENMVFVVDLPTTNTPPQEAQRTDFYDNLIAFLKAQKMPVDVLQKISSYDFSVTSKIGFVHSIGGPHSGANWRQTGHPGLGRTVAALGLGTDQAIQVDFVTSSVGSLNSEFLRSIYLAAQGDDGLTELTLRTAKKLPATAPLEMERNRKPLLSKGKENEWEDNFRFYFPTEATVKGSKGGPRKAGTICFSRTWWESSRFPRGNIRDCVSIRKGLLMHNKLANNASYTGWAYVGSANLSESAWGRLVHDKRTNSPKLNCRNWECGVLMPIPACHEASLGVSARMGGDGSPVTTVSSTADSDLGIFDKLLPVPMQHPGASFDSQKPWFFNSH